MGFDWNSLRRTAKERLAPGFSYAGDVTPGEAWQILADDTDAALVDVRTNAEWNFVGVPELSSLSKEPTLISWQRFPDMSQNQEFASELARAGVPSLAPALFICRSGARSAAVPSARGKHRAKIRCLYLSYDIQTIYYCFQCISRSEIVCTCCLLNSSSSVSLTAGMSGSI